MSKPFALRKYLVLWLLVLVLWFLIAGALFAQPKPFVVGLNAQQHTGSLDATGQAFTKELGAHSIRVAFNHGDHDFGVNWAVSNGMGVVFMLGYSGGCDAKTDVGRQCYADRSADLVKKYGKKVQYWEVWNEWNGQFGPYGDFAQNSTKWAEYTDLLKKTYAAIKAVDPSANVAGGVLAASSDQSEVFYRNMLRAGAGKFMDTFSMHMYIYRSDTTLVPNGTAAQGAEAFVNRAKLFNQITIDEHGSSIPIIVSETGFHGNNPARYQIEADYVKEMYKRAALLAFLKGVWWFQLEDSGAANAFGLVSSNNTKKPAFDAFKTAALLRVPTPVLGKPLNYRAVP